MTIDPTAQ